MFEIGANEYLSHKVIFRFSFETLHEVRILTFCNYNCNNNRAKKIKENSSKGSMINDDQ